MADLVKEKKAKIFTFDPLLLKIAYHRSEFLLFLGFLLFVMLGVTHIPIFYIGTDAVGLFDIYVVFIFCVILYRNPRFLVTPAVKSLITIYVIYLVYVSFNFFFFIPFHEYPKFATALWLKQIEFFLIGIISYYYIRQIDRKYVLYGIYLSVLCIAIYGMYRTFFGDWYRLGLPFFEGISSNPAGFSLGILLIVMLTFITDKKFSKHISKLIFWIVFLCGYASLILTISRTNNIAFFIVAFLFLLTRYKKKIISVLIIIAVLIGITYLLLFTVFREEVGDKGYILKYFLNPESALEDSSFQGRYGYLWLEPLDEWTANWFSMLFGIGLGTAKPVDNLFLAVIYNTGILGFFAYFSIFFYIFYVGDFRLRLTILFILINGIAAETTLNSFRSMQIVILYIMYLFHHYKKDELPEMKKIAHELKI